MEIVFQQKLLGKANFFVKMTDLAGKFWLLESALSEWFSLKVTIAWTVVHWARKLEKLLAQQENLLVSDDRMGNFLSLEVVALANFLISKFLMVIKHV